MPFPTNLSDDDARRVLNYLLRRAQTDPLFRRGLLSDPKTALQEELDLELPEDFNIRFVENAGADLTVILPDPDVPGDSLDEGDLDFVSGGTLGVLLEGVLLELLTSARTR